MLFISKLSRKEFNNISDVQRSITKKKRIEKKKIEMEFISTFSNFSGISKAWYPEESVVPFSKGIRGVDINRLSQDIRDVSWLGLVCDRWEDRFRIPLLVSVISTLTPTSRRINDIVNLYICIHAHTHRRENKREGKTWLDEKSPTTDREQISGFDLERHESGRPYTTMWNVETIW